MDLDKYNDGTSSTGISPLAESLFLSPPNSNVNNHLGFGKLVRCTSTPSYSSLLKDFDPIDPFSAENFPVQKDELAYEKNLRKYNDSHDSAFESQDPSCNSSYDGLSTRGK